MSELDDLAAYNQRRTHGAAASGPRGRFASPQVGAGELFRFGFFSGVGIWFAFVACSIVATLIVITFLWLVGDASMRHRAATEDRGGVSLSVRDR